MDSRNNGLMLRFDKTFCMIAILVADSRNIDKVKEIDEQMVKVALLSLRLDTTSSTFSRSLFWFFRASIATLFQAQHWRCCFCSTCPFFKKGSFNPKMLMLNVCGVTNVQWASTSFVK